MILYDSGSETVLILNEFLPFDFPHIILDFSGWQFQIQSIKSVAETGRSLDQSEYDFNSVKEEVETKLDLG
ncbi:hypothetical protein V8V48_11440 [Staphylococcus xylosus]|uniref:hypothetical protein n=1 Tax=Staphylococcus xylosus TaxID=1288 RepID=UPI0039995C02